MNLPGIKHRLISGFSIAALLFTAFFFLPDAGIPFVLAALAGLLASLHALAKRPAAALRAE